MTAKHTPRIPKANIAAYKAGAMIYKEGPKTEVELFQAIDFGTPGNRASKIANAIAGGWLIDIGGKIGIGEFARKHFAGEDEEPAPAYVGQVATVREPLTPLYSSPPLSAKYRVSSKGFRDDVPEYSVREQMRFSTLGGRSA